jgi:hypothetical protein
MYERKFLHDWTLTKTNVVSVQHFAAESWHPAKTVKCCQKYGFN